MFIFITALPQHAPRGCWTSLPVPAPSCPCARGQLTRHCMGPLDVPPLLTAASVPCMATLGVAEAGGFGFVFSSTARWFPCGPGESRWVRGSSGPS